MSVIIASIFVGMILIPIAAGWLLSAFAKEVYAPGRLLDVAGYKQHVFCRGELHALPPIVIEAGGGVLSPLYHNLVEALFKWTKVCIYDRPGMGWSKDNGNANAR